MNQDNEEVIRWTRVLLNGELVGALDPGVELPQGLERRELLVAGYQFAKHGFWKRVGEGRKRRDPGYLEFDCENTISCASVHCSHWH